MTRSTTNMDQGVRGWIVNQARENYWRVAGYVEFEDLLQDGGLIWAKVCARYPGVKDVKGRMGLFKTAYRNHLHDLSKKKTKADFLVREAELPQPLEFLRDCADPDQDAELTLTIRQLPPKIALILQRLYAENREHPFRLWLDRRETTNERLCRLAGLDPNVRHIRQALRAYFDGARLHPQYD